MTNDTQSETESQTSVRACANCAQPITGPWTRVLTADYTTEGYVASLAWQDYCLPGCSLPHARCLCECDAIPRELMTRLIAAVERDLGNSMTAAFDALDVRGQFAYAVGYATVMLAQAEIHAELDELDAAARDDGSPRP